MAQAHVIPQAIPESFKRTVPRHDWTIGIVGGAEPTGRALAQAALRCGFHVRIVDGGLTTMHSRLQVCSSIGDLGGVSVVVDASSGEGKLETVRDLDATLDPDTVILTYTAGSSVTKLAAATKHPERVVGLHIAQPAATGAPVEVVRALQTSDTAHDEACRFLRALGKTLVRVNDFPGFLVQRLHLPMINEACFVLQEGLASLEDIDAAVRLGDGAMGPLRLADEIGLDVCLSAMERLHREFGDGKYRPAPILRNYVAAGWLGRKAGRGFYTYD